MDICSGRYVFESSLGEGGGGWAEKPERDIGCHTQRRENQHFNQHQALNTLKKKNRSNSHTQPHTKQDTHLYLYIPRDTGPHMHMLSLSLSLTLKLTSHANTRTGTRVYKPNKNSNGKILMEKSKRRFQQATLPNIKCLFLPGVDILEARLCRTLLVDGVLSITGFQLLCVLLRQ